MKSQQQRLSYNDEYSSRMLLEKQE